MIFMEKVEIITYMLIELFNFDVVRSVFTTKTIDVKEK